MVNMSLPLDEVHQRRGTIISHPCDAGCRASSKETLLTESSCHDPHTMPEFPDMRGRPEDLHRREGCRILSNIFQHMTNIVLHDSPMTFWANDIQHLGLGKVLVRTHLKHIAHPRGFFERAANVDRVIALLFVVREIRIRLMQVQAPISPQDGEVHVGARAPKTDNKLSVRCRSPCTAVRQVYKSASLVMRCSTFQALAFTQCRMIASHFSLTWLPPSGAEVGCTNNQPRRPILSPIRGREHTTKTHADFGNKLQPRHLKRC